MKKAWRWAANGLLIALLAACGQSSSTDPAAQGAARELNTLDMKESDKLSWPMGGQDYRNTRSNTEQKKTNIHNVNQLALRWKIDTAGDVSATPAVVDGAVYFPDWSGDMYKVDARSGGVLWKKRLPSDGGMQAIARTSPAVVENIVYIGDQHGYVEALSTESGSILWRTRPNPGPFPVITQSPVVYNGVVYVGSASAEEGVAANSSYACCTFRGSFQALDAHTGAVLWQTFMTPQGYSGAGIWSSTPALDTASNTVYITTGNNYKIPPSVTACFTSAGSDPAAQHACVNPDNHVDSIMALDMNTGRIKWATSALVYDSWNVACIFGGVNCPPGAGPDFDFGAGANLMTIDLPGGKKMQVVGAGQKSGQYWMLDAATGAVLWNTQVGPGSTLGGIEWGTATDGKRIYVAIANLNRLPYPGRPDLGNAGSFAALDPETGAVLWQVKDPNPFMDLGAVSVSNGVVYAGSMSGHMYALDAESGKIGWTYLGAGSSNAGPAIDNDGAVFWGNGYERFGLGIPGHAFYAFSRGGK